MRHLPLHRFTALTLSLAILAVPTIVMVLTAAPRGCAGGFI